MSNFEYHLHDNPAALRFQLSGDWSGDGAREIEQVWRTALSTIGGRRLVVDITHLRSLTDEGSELLEKWRTRGVLFVARSCDAKKRLQDQIACSVMCLATMPGDCAHQLQLMAALNLSDTCPVSGCLRQPSRMQEFVAGIAALIGRTCRALAADNRPGTRGLASPWIPICEHRKGIEPVKSSRLIPICPKLDSRRL